MKSATPLPRHVVTPAPAERGFRFRTGEVARSLQEFQAILERLRPFDAAYHRTHFHHWLRDVIGDRTLASEAERLGNSEESTEAAREKLVQAVARRVENAEARAALAQANAAPAVTNPRVIKEGRAL